MELARQPLVGLEGFGANEAGRSSVAAYLQALSSGQALPTPPPSYGAMAQLVPNVNAGAASTSPFSGLAAPEAPGFRFGPSLTSGLPPGNGMFPSPAPLIQPGLSSHPTQGLNPFAPQAQVNQKGY
jgi:hypothetical protein